jgi:hypothetical protein
MKNKLLGFGFLISLLFSVLILNLPARAVNMESENYKIQWGNINIGGGKKSSTSYTVTDTIGQNAPGLYTGAGYTVRSGFQYIHTIVPFSFVISDLTIDLGSLSIGNSSVDTNTLTVTAGGANGYEVLAYEVHPLRSENNDDIPDTTCDNGSCDETNAEEWTQDTTYGFGYNIQGDDIPADFTNSDYFRQFANDEAGEVHQSVMSNNSVTEQSQATVRYKANISATQETGSYETSIVYIAVPKY